MKLIPKSWWAKEACAVATSECRSVLETLATACALSLECVDTNYTEPTDWNVMLKTPDIERWLPVVKLEFDTLVKMGCWEVVDIPIDAPLLDVRWVPSISSVERFILVLVIDNYRVMNAFLFGMKSMSRKVLRPSPVPTSLQKQFDFKWKT